MVTPSHFNPYPKFRDQQRSVIPKILKSLKRRKTIVLGLSNGAGKTVVALSAILSYVRNYNEVNYTEKLKIFVATKTNNQSDNYIRELNRLFENKGVLIEAIDKRGRSSYCINEDVKSKPFFHFLCNSLRSANACRYYSNCQDEDLNYEISERLYGVPISSDNLLNQCRKLEICPAEISNALTSISEVVVGSYQYLFNPDHRQKLLNLLDVEMDRLVVIVDEAHNLPHQVTELNQPVLSSKDLDYAIKEAKYHKSETHMRFFGVLQTVMRDYYTTSEKEDGLVELDKAEFMKLIGHQLKEHDLTFNKKFIEEMARIGRKYSKRSAKRMISSNYERMAEFLFTMIESSKFNSVLFILENTSSVRLRLIELDPVIKIRPVLKNTHKSLLMSGSLPDIDIFKKQIGLIDFDYISMDAEYTSKNVMVRVVRDLSSQYSRRTDKMIRDMSKVIVEVINTKRVNTLIFSSSYKFARMLHDLYSKETDRIIMRTNRTMTALETDRLVHDFKQCANNGTAVLGTIQGGRINEGTDFPGNTAQIIILSGIAFPPFDLIMKRRVGYNKRYSDNPLESVYYSKALQQLIQSVGRGIRSLDDKVYVVVMDDRLLQEKYSKLLPDYLKLNMMEIVNNPRAISLQGKYFLENF